MPSSTDVDRLVLSRRERKRQLSREQLYQSALALFIAQGFDDTTVDQIAARADVARATAFNYFPQKVAYLEEWGHRRRAVVARRLADQHVETAQASEQLRAYLTEMANLNIEDRAEAVALMEPSVRVGRALRVPTLDVELAAIIARGQESGEFRADFDADQAGQLLGAAYFSTVLRWVDTEPEPFKLRTRLIQTLELLLHGMTRDDPGAR